MFFGRKRRKQSASSDLPDSHGEAFESGGAGNGQDLQPSDETDYVLQWAMLGTQLSHAIRVGDHRKCHKVVQLFRQHLAEGREEAPSLTEPQTNRVIVSPLFLIDSFRFVFQPAPSSPGFREVFHYCGGVAVDSRTFVVTDLVPVRFAYQHAGGVRADNSSNVRALERLDKIGGMLVAHIHSHPGYGPEANHPSEIDRRFAERLARGNHVAVGGIFSRDRDEKGVGYVRFFAHESKPFVVDVQGKERYVRKVSENVYRVALAEPDISIRAD